MATSTLGSGTLVLAGTTSGTTTVTATAVAGTTTLTLPAATDTLVGRATTDTLTNKTLTSPTITGAATFAAGTAAAPAITTTGDTNTGIWFPAADTIAFTEGGVESMRIDSSGNLGLGVTPSAWGSGYKALQINNGGIVTNTGGTFTAVLSNAFFDGTNYKYVSTAAASMYRQNAGVHDWNIAPSGTAGNAVTFTQAMTLDASGNLGVGTTSPATRLVVGGSTGNYGLQIAARTDFSSISGQLLLTDNTGSACMYSASGSLVFATGATVGTNGGTERARIDSSGNFLVGTTGKVYEGKISVSFDGNGGAGAQGIALIDTNASLSGDYALFVNSSGNVAGRITHNGTTSVNYGSGSDYRLKDITGPVTNAANFINALKPKVGTWKADGSKFVGFLAHEFAEICPQAVVGEKDGVDADGNPIYQSMEASNAEVIANMVSLLQEQQALITTLTARITALEGV